MYNLETIEEIIGIRRWFGTKLGAVFDFRILLTCFVFVVFCVWRSAEIRGFESSEECSALH